MELFSEIYSCYYQVMRHLLSNQNAVSMQDIRVSFQTLLSFDHTAFQPRKILSESAVIRFPHRPVPCTGTA